MEQLSQSRLPKNASRNRRWVRCRLSRFLTQHLHRPGTWHLLQRPFHESLLSLKSLALSRCISRNISTTIPPLFKSRSPVRKQPQPLLWQFPVREATPDEVDLEVEHHDMLHLLIKEVAEEVEMDRAVSRLRALTTLPFPPVQTLQDVVFEEAEEAMDRTGIATFLHPSTPRFERIPDGITQKARAFFIEGRTRPSRVMDHFPFSCTSLFTLQL